MPDLTLDEQVAKWEVAAAEVAAHPEWRMPSWLATEAAEVLPALIERDRARGEVCEAARAYVETWADAEETGDEWDAMISAVERLAEVEGVNDLL